MVTRSAWTGERQPCCIAHAKLERVTALVRESGRCVSDEAIRAFILGDRSEGDGYQEWLDAAGAPVLAAWLVAQLPART